MFENCWRVQSDLVGGASGNGLQGGLGGQRTKDVFFRSLHPGGRGIGECGIVTTQWRRQESRRLAVRRSAVLVLGVLLLGINRGEVCGAPLAEMSEEEWCRVKET